MERQTGPTAGITFGNAAAGAGTGDSTLLNAGSKGTMERVTGPASGITFGNQAAGAGSAGDGTLLNAGSKGIMERGSITDSHIMGGANAPPPPPVASS
mmetsp:Transcript_20282/g.60510  ORF Transcript_20282/g.60510 Transcript_20282/m.60510 type:complete len:98 (-) Transcript_20282:57-350(-)